MRPNIMVHRFLPSCCWIYFMYSGRNWSPVFSSSCCSWCNHSILAQCPPEVACRSQNLLANTVSSLLNPCYALHQPAPILPACTLLAQCQHLLDVSQFCIQHHFPTIHSIIYPAALSQHLTSQSLNKLHHFLNPLLSCMCLHVVHVPLVASLFHAVACLYWFLIRLHFAPFYRTLHHIL